MSQYDVHTRKEIANPFKIDFHIRHLDDILEVRVGLNDRLEDLFGDTGDETFQILRVDVRTLVRVSDPPLQCDRATQHTIMVNVFPLPV